eukprot:CAMPEP_0182445108 /NCGR_PEP_ID=MMETSP1172-20130603/3349_1 /TAXON_ID=708627 /ORGANISM="Timspurckia oligopyrenoides, Strain CCMP3278" /LENGTH=1157 /DNA_ID=CAMNT_0024640817 /DNA_START=148 /DNA_END=3621 /DNA_ORIENTATION=+
METLTGASGKTWKLKKGQALVSGAGGGQAGYRVESVVVRDQESRNPYVLKRVTATDPSLFELLIDEAASWRKVGIAAGQWPPNVIELVDVFVDRDQLSVAYLMEFCSGGHLNRRGASQSEILSAVSQVCTALLAVQNSGMELHGNINYSTIMIGADGQVKLGGFGAGRRIALEEGSSNDVRALGSLIYELSVGRPAARSGKVRLPAEAYSILNASTVELTNRALGSRTESLPELKEFSSAVSDILSGRTPAVPPTGAAPAAKKQASVLQSMKSSKMSGASNAASNLDSLAGKKSLRDMVQSNKRPSTAKTQAPSRAPSVFGNMSQSHSSFQQGPPPGASPFSNPNESGGTIDAMLSKATAPTPAAFDPASLKWLMVDFRRDAVRCSDDVFRALFKLPMSQDPVIAFKALCVIHWLILEIPNEFLACTLKQDKFLEWVQGTWTKESITSETMRSYPTASCFVNGEISVLAAYLRMKTRFHHKCQYAWNGRFGIENPGFLEGRERKVMQGLEELFETLEEIALALMESTDEAHEMKLGAAKTLAVEMSRGYEAVCALVDSIEKARTREKLSETYEKCHALAYSVLSTASQFPEIAKSFPRDAMLEIPETAPDIIGLASNVVPPRSSYPTQAPPAHTRSAGGNFVEDAGEDDDYMPPPPPMPEPPPGFESYAPPDDEDDEDVESSKKKKKKKDKKSKKKRSEEDEDESDMFFKGGASVDGQENGASGLEIPEEGAMVLHGTNVVGQLIQLPEEAPTPAPVGPMRVNPDATSEDILAEALGLDPSAAQAARMLALPAPDDYSEEDDSDEEGGPREPRVPRESGGWTSTKTMQLAVVAAQSNPTIEKSHPPYCQCAMCTTAEAVQHTYLLTEKGETQEVIGATIDLNKRNTREYEVDPKLIKIGDKIGEGAFGTVHKGRFKNKTVAVKVLNRKMMRNKQVIKEFKSEIGIMCQLDHPNVIKCLGVCTKPPNYMMITEFMPRGTLYDVLHKGQMQLNWVLMKRIVLDIVRGMAYIHASDLLHRDLKSSNLLLDGSFNVKIGDFGLVHFLDSNDNSLSGGGPVGHAGTYQYMAPEVIANDAATEKSDVYSFAILLWEIMARKLPYLGMDPQMVAQNVLSNHLRPPIMPFFPQPMAVLMNACWHYEPSKRPSFVDIEAIVKKLPG